MSQLYIPSLDEILTVSHSRGAASDAPHLWDGLVGAWKMQEGGGLTAFDVSGHGNHGTLTNMDPATDWVVGRHGYALDFDGPTNANRVGVPFIINPATSDLTLSAWVKSDQNNGSNQSIFQQNDGGGAGRTWLFKRGGGNVLETFISGSGLQGEIIPVGEWMHCVLVVKGDNRQLYQDGLLTASDVRTLEAATGSYNIGHHKTGTDNISWDGLIDDVRIYSRALSASEITQLYSDPWAAYRLRRRVFGPVAAGGVNTRRYSLPTLGVG